mgnify:CR=1 FL=1
MNFERFTVKTREALQRAHEIAGGLQNPEVAPEHVLLALLDQENSLAKDLLKKTGVPVEKVRSRLKEAIQGYPRSTGGEFYLSPSRNSWTAPFASPTP